VIPVNDKELNPGVITPPENFTPKSYVTYSACCGLSLILTLCRYSPEYEFVIMDFKHDLSSSNNSTGTGDATKEAGSSTSSPGAGAVAALNNEPLLFSFSLHNIKTKQKVSEDWCIVTLPTFTPIVSMTSTTGTKRVPVFCLWGTSNNNSSPHHYYNQHPSDLADIYMFVRVFKLFTNPNMMTTNSGSNIANIISSINNNNITTINIKQQELVSYLLHMMY
jgi:hypothetical protein